MTLTLPRFHPPTVAEPEAPKKPRSYPSLREAFDTGRRIAPNPVRGHLFDAAGRRACAWGAIMLGFGFGQGGDDYELSRLGPKGIGGIRLDALHMGFSPDPHIGGATPIRDAVIYLNDTGHWTDNQFREWLGKVDRAIEEHLD